MISPPAVTGRHAAAQASETLDAAQYLTFMLGHEAFAMPISFIREIIEYDKLTTIPLMPGFLRGVINLRGAVVPVIDLSVRFGREATAVGRRTCIVIIELSQDEATHSLGIIVDAVNEVMSVEQSSIEARPSFGANIKADFISGMFHQGGGFVIILDIAQSLSVEELATIAEASISGNVPEDAAD